MKKFETKAIIPAKPDAVYKAWLSAKLHAAMTGGAATGSGKLNAKFTAWDGYISGKNLELKPGKKIVQSWRTVEFPPDAPDSQLVVKFNPHPKGCELIIQHTNIPNGQSDYKKGWRDHYFIPMKAYFSGK
jgi:activator of HSP90 ATPase